MLPSLLFSVSALVGFTVAKTAVVKRNYAVTINGVTYNPAAGKSTKLSKITPSSKTLGVYNYTLTGHKGPLRVVTSPTVVYASKVASLTAAQLAGVSIKDFQLQDDTLVLTFNTGAGKLKLQVKDGAQGGIFQMETEFASNVTFTHVLGPTIFYFVNSVTKKINFGNGIGASTDPVKYHNMLLGKDSQQVATKTFQSGSTTKWNVAPGGRLGGVLGGDATELGAGASNCTLKCQAQNQIKGYIPPTQDPINPTPVGARAVAWKA